MARKPLELTTLQQQANEYARDTFTNTPFYLDGVTHDFDRIAGAIMKALVSAWAAGFAAGRKS